MKTRMTSGLADIAKLVEQLQQDHRPPQGVARPPPAVEVDPYQQGVLLGKRSADAFRNALRRSGN